MTGVYVEVAVVPSAAVVVVVEGDAVPVVGENVAEAVQPKVDRKLTGVPAKVSIGKWSLLRLS